MNQGSLHEAESQPSPKKMRSSPMKPDVMAEHKLKGTLYITVGPQCAGKTTVLKQIFGQSFHRNEGSMTKEEAFSAGVDVTIDDQALVYIPVPTSYFLSNATEDATSCTGAYYPSLNETIFGKTIRERILDPSNEELVSVIQRLSGALGADEFALRLKGNAETGEGGAKTPQDDLIDAVEQVIQQQHASNENEQMLPETIELFVVESIFRPRPLDLLQQLSGEQMVHPNTSALDEALHLLNTTAADARVHSPAKPLSWGNTNTRPREFKNALEAASNSGRPVQFIVFGGMEACEMIREHVSRREYRKHHESDATVAADADIEAKEGVGQLLCLPKLDRQTLFTRNLLRFCNTGRYIPSNAISDAMVRVESLLASAVAEANKDYTKEGTRAESSLSNAKFRLDSELAKMAGYRMNADRTVSLAHSTGNGDRNNRYQRNNQPRRDDYHRNRQQGGYFGVIRMTGEHTAIKEGEGATATSSEKRAVGRLDNIKPDQGTGIMTGAKIQTEEDLMDAAGAAVVGAVANSVNLSRLLQASLSYEHVKSACKCRTNDGCLI
ncbi:hypothetical protein ACHAXT_005417 [Thalassiosira profunda]